MLFKTLCALALSTTLLVATSCGGGGSADLPQTGQRLTDDQLCMFTLGKSTRTQVVKALGMPQQTIEDQDGTLLVYSYIAILPTGASSSQLNYFNFDSMGILVAFSRAGSGDVSIPACLRPTADGGFAP